MLSNHEIKSRVQAIIGEAAGAASMCWLPPPSTQVFDSNRAAGIVDIATAEILSVIAAVLESAQPGEAND